MIQRSIAIVTLRFIICYRIRCVSGIIVMINIIPVPVINDYCISTTIMTAIAAGVKRP